MLSADDLVAIIRPALDRAESPEARCAALARLSGGEIEADREWPPDRIDRDDPYWEWKKLDDAADAQCLYKRSKLHLIRHDVSLPASNCPRAPRWFSVRRIREVYGADLPVA